jgi:hypothetical protein
MAKCGSLIILLWFSQCIKPSDTSSTKAQTTTTSPTPQLNPRRPSSTSSSSSTDSPCSASTSRASPVPPSPSRIKNLRIQRQLPPRFAHQPHPHQVRSQGPGLRHRRGDLPNVAQNDHNAGGAKHYRRPDVLGAYLLPVDPGEGGDGQHGSILLPSRCGSGHVFRFILLNVSRALCSTC